MKNIFKKNQIIITALAIMIAIAGYLNFSDRGDKDALETNNPDVLDYETVGETMGDDIAESDIFDEGVLLDDTVLDLADNADGSTDVTEEDGTTETADEEGTEDLATVDVSDTGEVKAADAVETEEDTETSTPGEAVLVSTTTSVDFFEKNRLEREQKRAMTKTTLLEIIDSENLTEAAKEEAINKMMKMTEIADKENDTEMLLEAKGFSDPMVTLSDEEVEVVLNAASLTEKEVAQITDIVTRKTGMEVKNVHIAPVVATE
ncbi:MAG: SpoIIIAH-like family protein [Anaerocolumna sp.]